MAGFLVQTRVTEDRFLNDHGQAAIEFVLVIGFALGITFLFISQSFSATKGYLVHYVNYMASRIYLSYDQGLATPNSNYRVAEREARAYISTFNLSDNFQIDMNCEFQSFAQNRALFTGSICSFEAVANFFPTVGGGEPINLVSESFLGKEPPRASCFELTCEAITGSRTDCAGQSTSLDVTLYDNGC